MNILGWGANKEKQRQEEELEFETETLKIMEELMQETKDNPAQEEIATDQLDKTQYTSRYSQKHINSYNNIETVNRGVNLIADGVAEFKIDVKDKINDLQPRAGATYVRSDKLNRLLNYKANPYTSAQEFKRQIAVEILLEGNAFIYYDRNYLYLLPSLKVEIVPDKVKFIKEYKYGDQVFKPSEIIHIRDNSADSIYRGASRLSSAQKSTEILESMNKYQQNFFKNNTILGVVLSTPDMLSDKIKRRKILEWMRDYNPTSGGRRPVILDGGFKMEEMTKYNFKELDFAESVNNQKKKILEALGVPPILLDSGNNANISPNLKLLYTSTIMPIVDNIVANFEIYFGFDLKAVSAEILALRPELRELANYYSTLVNAGIMTRNEARERLRLEPSDQDIADELILPANIAGSAQDSTQGGRPPGDNED